MGDHTDAENDFDSDDDDSERDDADENIDISDDDDEDENSEDDEPTQESYTMDSPSYKLKPNHQASFLDTDDDIDNDTNVSYKVEKECGTGEMNSTCAGGNVNTAMESEDTTTPMPAFSSGSGVDIHTESDEESDEESDDESEYKVGDVTESTKMKEVVPDDLNAAPSDNHTPLLNPIHEGFM